MTPTELRLYASHAIETVDANKFNDSPIFKEVVWTLANHVFDTVREDDGEEITAEYAKSIGAPPAIIRYENNRRVWVYKFEYERVTIRTRGQLRRLLEGLGVDSAK